MTAARLAVLGIIPARAGSKGVPRKNTSIVGGKPLVAWTWEAASAAPSLKRVIVSTNDAEVSALARAAGVDAPFRRPDALASDTSLAIDVAEHALAWLESTEKYRPDAVVWLQPTSPLRTAEDIEGAIALFTRRSAAAVVSVCEADHHPFWYCRLSPDGVIQPWLRGDKPSARRQELPSIYRLNGAIYMVKREVLLRERTFEPEPTIGYVMPAERSIDVDTSWDLHLADLVLRERMSDSDSSALS